MRLTSGRGMQRSSVVCSICNNRRAVEVHVRGEQRERKRDSCLSVRAEHYAVLDRLCTPGMSDPSQDCAIGALVGLDRNPYSLMSALQAPWECPYPCDTFIIVYCFALPAGSPQPAGTLTKSCYLHALMLRHEITVPFRSSLRSYTKICVPDESGHSMHCFRHEDTDVHVSESENLLQ